MNVYQGTIGQFKELWNYSNSNTYNYFLEGLKKDIIEFWTVEVDNRLVAELYIFWDSVDKDEANGVNRAYLCAYRVEKKFQGKGIGSSLMNRVFNRIEEKGFSEITIGIDNREYQKLSSMYNKFGFTQVVKETNIDNHYINEVGKPTKYKEPFKIMLCNFEGGSR